MSIQQEWQAYTNWLASYLPATLIDLNAGAHAADFDYFEQVTSISLPKNLHELYSIHNGQKGMAPGLFIGLTFMPLAEVAHATNLQRGWLPFATDHSGNYIGLHLKTGKVICFSNTPQAEVLHKNLSSFFREQRQQCSSRAFMVPQSQGELMFGLGMPRTGD